MTEDDPLNDLPCSYLGIHLGHVWTYIPPQIDVKPKDVISIESYCKGITSYDDHNRRNHP